MAKRRMGQSGSGGRYRSLGESGRDNAEERLSEQKTEMLQQRAVQESDKKTETNNKVKISKEQADAFQNLANMMVSEAPNMKEAKKVADELAKAVQNPDKETGEIKIGDYTVSKDGDIKQSVKKHITSYMYTGILTEDRPVSPPATSSFAFPLPGSVDVTPPKQGDDAQPGGGGAFNGMAYTPAGRLYDDLNESEKPWVKYDLSTGIITEEVGPPASPWGVNETWRKKSDASGSIYF